MQNLATSIVPKIEKIINSIDITYVITEAIGVSIYGVMWGAKA